ncbi:DNA topoisomerase IV subunit A [Candidatus Woesearchaeota archaeon]|nr:DNA topoisomerase IV subunit A [Candidatus Woesearchaeota archaeon]
MQVNKKEERRDPKITTIKLKKAAENVVEEAHKHKNPYIDIPVRSLSNVHFNEQQSIIELGKELQRRYFFNVAQAKKFLQTFLIASACKTLIDSGKTTSIRDLYYMTKHTIGDSNENTFDDQMDSDLIIEDLEVTIDALREELNLFASNRGALVGPLKLIDSGDKIDCSKMGSGGWSVPSIVEKNLVEFESCEAKFILMVEKDAVWRRLNEDKFWKKHKCILIHGQGMAPRGVRRLLFRLVNELKLPLYVFVDNDPWGFYIYSVIKQGSINLAYESQRMAVPSAKFLGLSSFDKDIYKLPDNVTIKLNEQDKSRAKQIIQYPWFKSKEWQKELSHMLKQGVKLELEALSAKGISFVTDTYLPDKINNKKWLD